MRESHLGYVCEGELEIDFKGAIVRAGQGDGIFISAGKQHKARPTGEKVLLFLVEDA